ncbi:gamma-glutamylcyclotransferase [Rhodobacteraceae bacterium LMO-12]|nr:gamma-glutamylcyclotransferase [Rhodobacteraceae bacterium LMO-JJ12]
MTAKTKDKPKIGILAYGSLISDPRLEIEKTRTDIIKDVLTPFSIEFARSSSGRGGAPTLVPVTTGGARVKGQVFVMDTSEADAADILYRREIGKVGEMKRSYTQPSPVTDKSVVVERLTNFAGLDVVLYTQIAATITPLTAEHLAKLAIASVSKANPGLDGVSYLIAAKQHGITTALSPTYEAEILKQTACKTLEDALAKLKR